MDEGKSVQVLTPQNRDYIVEYAKRLKSGLRNKYKIATLSVSVSRSATSDPYITVSGKGTQLPETMLRDCLTAIYGPHEADKALTGGMGNIRNNYVALHASQWQKIIP